MPVGGRTVARAGGRSVYGHVITNFTRMARLLHFLTHGVPLAGFAREVRNEDGQTHYLTRYVTVRWFSSFGLSDIGCLRILNSGCVTICALAYLAK